MDARPVTATAARSALAWIAAALAVGVVAFAAFTALRPLLADRTTLGIHDWDTHAAHRYLPVLSLLRYHEGPWWSPWFCGGYPAWGYSEGAASLVSPFLPFYLFAPLPVALRVEIFGTTLLAAAGTMLLVGRYTSSWALRALVAVIFALNGRWALQATSGHAWHLQYAYLPWVLWLADRAIAGRLRDAYLAGAVLALLVYVGGIYPLPHAALALVVLCTLQAALRRSARPLAVLAVAGATAIALGAPKLLPVLDTMRRAPRLVESVETTGLGQALLMLTARDQGMKRPPAGIGAIAHGWHEFGMYVGVGATVALAAGLLLRAHGKARAYRIAAALFVVLSFGAFDTWSPWTLLHHLPAFSSQHVPSRLLHPAALLAGVALAAALEARFGRFLRRRPWLDLALLVPVAAIALDIAGVSANVLREAFTQAPPSVPEAASFHHEKHAPVDYPHPAWATPVYLAMLANTGALECWAVPTEFERGAIATGAPEYRGEAYVVNGTGDARVASWTPNGAVIEVKNASSDATLVYNMNFDPSWRANGAPAIEWAHAVAAPLIGGDQRIELRYRPRTLWAGLALAAAGLAAGLVAFRTRRAAAR